MISSALQLPPLPLFLSVVGRDARLQPVPIDDNRKVERESSTGKQPMTLIYRNDRVFFAVIDH